MQTLLLEWRQRIDRFRAELAAFAQDDPLLCACADGLDCAGGCFDELVSLDADTAA
jgi:hypothetical protein